MVTIEVNISTQLLSVMKEEKVAAIYQVSTAKNGVGELYGSEKTPRGWHVIRAKIGHDCVENTIFKARRPTGEIYSPALKQIYPQRDWILTRILWLSGLEVGKNRLYQVDTMRRYIYIHGAPPESKMGIPGSKGCIRMENKALIELFNMVSVGTKLLIVE